MPPTDRAEDYAHSPAHLAIARGDHSSLANLVSSLPKLADPATIRTESDSLAQEKLAKEISAVLDRRDVPSGETPLHLAVRLNDDVSVQTLSCGGANVFIRSPAGWTPLEESIRRRFVEVSRILVRREKISRWCSWRRRLPRLIAGLHRMCDFYLEIQFHFESSIIPFIDKIAPSDTYRVVIYGIWKRDGNLRADCTLAGFDGMKIKRVNRSVLFLGDGDFENDIPEGSLLVLNRDKRKFFNAFEKAGDPMSDEAVTGAISKYTVLKPGLDFSKAELVSRTNWRRQEKTETVGEWKTKVYEINNVVFSFTERNLGDIAGNDGVSEGKREESVFPPELNEEEGFPVVENPADCGVSGDKSRRHSSFGGDNVKPARSQRRRASSETDTPRARVPAPVTVTKEKKLVHSLRPTVWLTEQFPLKTEEFRPLLEILVKKVKAVKKMKELLSTKIPTGSFPVKISIPVVPTVKVVITFTKFIHLQPTEVFYTPTSSPTHLSSGGNSPPDEEIESRSTSSSSSSSWLRLNTSSRSTNKSQKQCTDALDSNPFDILNGYTQQSIDSIKLEKKKSKPPTKA